MNQRLANKLIRHYQMTVFAIKWLSWLFGTSRILKKTETHIGVCNCASKRYKVETLEDPWVLSRCFMRTNRWTDFPRQFSENKHMVIKLLKLRIEILKQFPN